MKEMKTAVEVISNGMDQTRGGSCEVEDRTFENFQPQQKTKEWKKGRKPTWNMGTVKEEKWVNYWGPRRRREGEGRRII